MSLMIDRLFDRLAATYGAAWERSLGSAPMADVKTAWGSMLQNFGGERMGDVAWALDNLPDRPPNAIEFRALCRRAPAAPMQSLPEPKADPARVAAEMAKLQPLRAAAATHDPKAWARRIFARHEAGDPVTPISLRFAREALGIKPSTSH